MTLDERRADPPTTARTDRPALVDAWHQQTEDEVAAAWEYGVLCGLRVASAAMDRALDEAVGGVHYSAKQVVEQLVAAMDREVARARHEQ